MNPAEARTLRILITSSVVAKIADYGLTLIVPLAVLAKTGSPAGAILTLAMRGIAYVASPFIGSLIDRFDRRTVFVVSQVEQAACLAAAAFFLGTPYVVAAAMLVSGLGGVAASITGQFVLIPQLISQDHRQLAVARLASAIEFAKVGGFLTGGLALSVLDPSYAAWLVAACYLTAGLLALLLPVVAAVPRTTQSLWSDIKIGFSWLAKPEIGWLVATMALSNLALGGLESVLVTVMGADKVAPFLISGTLAAGLLVGAFGARLTPRVLTRWTTPVRILVFQLAAGLGFVLITLASANWILMLAYAVLCFALGLSNVVSVTFRQDTIPVELAGRVNSVIRMFIAGAIPLSGMIYALAESRRVWIWLPALILEAASLILWAAFVVRRRTRHPATP